MFEFCRKGSAKCPATTTFGHENSAGLLDHETRSLRAHLSESGPGNGLSRGAVVFSALHARFDKRVLRFKEVRVSNACAASRVSKRCVQ